MLTACAKVWRRMVSEYFAVMKGECIKRTEINFDFATSRRISLNFAFASGVSTSDLK